MITVARSAGADKPSVGSAGFADVPGVGRAGVRPGSRAHHAQALAVCHAHGVPLAQLDEAGVERFVARAEEQFHQDFRERGWRITAQVTFRMMTRRSGAKGPISARPGALATLARWAQPGHHPVVPFQ
jgi:hypothetical protein